LGLAVYHHGVTYLSADDFEQGERHMRRALDIAGRAALSAWATFIRSSLSDLLVAHGRWAEASSEAEQAEAQSRSLGPRPGGSYPLLSLGRILLLRGERDEGLLCVHEALAMAMQYEHLPGITRAHETLAWQEVRAGRPEEAIARLEPIVERRRAAGRPWYPTVYAWALLELGNEERAADALRGARQLANASTSRTGLPPLLLQSAKLGVRQGRLDDAMRHLEEGLAIAQEIGLPYQEALLQEEYGRMHAARGEREQARARLENALAIFRRLGALTDVGRVGETLRDFRQHVYNKLQRH
jgi:tetratricopeptide (TPR) repeat protein